MEWMGVKLGWQSKGGKKIGMMKWRDKWAGG